MSYSSQGEKPPIAPVASGGRSPAGRALDTALEFEPFWTWPAAALVFLTVVFPGISWAVWPAALALPLPFALRCVRLGYPSVRTPFDVPIGLLLLGGILGALVSDSSVSLGALLTLFALAAVFYSMVNYARPRGLMVVLVAATLVGVAAYGVSALFWGGPRTPASVQHLKDLLPFISALPELPQPQDQVYPWTDFVHGFALVLAVADAILIGVAVGRGRRRLRLASGTVAAVLTSVALLVTWGSLRSLMTGASIVGRYEEHWLPALKYVLGHPSAGWTGMGLGTVASQPFFGHINSAYLELWLNTGVMGVAATVIAGVATAKLAVRIVRSPRTGRWHGLGLGLVGACLVTALVGVAESSPFAIYLRTKETYLWMASPLPWILAASLVVVSKPTSSSSD